MEYHVFVKQEQDAIAILRNKVWFLSTDDFIPKPALVEIYITAVLFARWRGSLLIDQSKKAISPC